MSFKKAFTLAEILVVMLIISVLAAIAVPNYVSFMNQGAVNAVQNNLINIYHAQQNYYFNKGSYCLSSCDNLPDMDNTSTLSLSLTDNNFSYACNVGGSVCTATNNSDHGNVLTLTLTSPIILPGSSNLLNPMCTSDNNNYPCPN